MYSTLISINRFMGADKILCCKCGAKVDAESARFELVAGCPVATCYECEETND